MKRLILTFALAILVLFLLVSCNKNEQESSSVAEEPEAVFEASEGLQYALSDDESYYTVVGYSGAETEVYIPATHRRLPVKEIGEGAFEHCTFITSVGISDGVEAIRVNAFYQCYRLTDVIIPKSVTRIGGGAFASCTDLPKDPSGITYVDRWVVACDPTVKAVTVREGVLGIAEYAFQGCSQMSSINLPASLRHIGANAFFSCDSITEITIPDGVRSIGDEAFGCYSLTEIIIPDSVCEIGYGAFSRCTALVTETLPSGMTVIPDRMFDGCHALKHVTIPTSVPTICRAAFSNSGIEEIVIPDSVTVMEDMVFRGSLLKRITIPDSVKTIGDRAFTGCKQLVEVKFPSNITITDTSSLFYGCHSLTTVTLPATVTNISERMFNECRSLVCYVIPESVTDVDLYSFHSARIEQLVLPTSVTSLTISFYRSSENFREESVAAIFYCGNEKEWEPLKQNLENTVGAIPSDIYFYSEVPPSTTGRYWHYDENGNVSVWK